MRAETLLEALRRVPEPRRRQGRRYTGPALLAGLLLAALNGETSLRGMWIWARAHAALLCPTLFWDTGRIPALGTFWRFLTQLDEQSLLAVINRWLALWKGRRGRENFAGKQAERGSGPESSDRSGDRDESGPRPGPGRRGGRSRGRAPFARTDSARWPGGHPGCRPDGPLGGTASGRKRGAYLGPLKGNQPGLAGAVGLYLEDRKTLARPPDALSWDKGHGRIECREVWLEECPELGEYGAKEMGWPGLKWCGWWRRCRRQGGVEEENVDCRWGVRSVDAGTSSEVAARALGHRELCLPCAGCDGRRRPASRSEDRLSILRSVGINFARWLGHRYVPDAQRHLSASGTVPGDWEEDGILEN